MASRAQPAAFALLRTTHHTLRTGSTNTSIAAPTTIRPLSTLQTRTPSPPPYQTSSSKYPSPSTTHWTRFRTPYSFTSTRRFTRPSAPLLLADHSSSSSASSTPPLSQETTDRINAIIETITDLYGTARDEFEMAAEETEKNTTYAAEDRRAAREAVDELIKYYEQCCGGTLVGGGAIRSEGGRVRMCMDDRSDGVICERREKDGDCG
ncbi:uncharacterized protein EI97DRAFT_173820 [Westerdykella ornata]|uniref:Uncharacterized protein n=1 Tax=Westerdykella ornata TaxID=318751 RepID=A0A6A6JUE3_WESOR|nr:uncharacterized protein EI97DRAFT_173820 [Westerdykella ornata]KAF2279366.1 hypothetical protein EI97DRAFT_173820 [Westerdykella ornata]